MDELQGLRKRLEYIEARNQRVESEKQWETGITRKAILFITTYVLIGLYMWMINVSQPWLNAVIPALGFLVSTLTIQWAKNIFVKRKNQ